MYQSTEFEVGETLGISATVDEDDTCYDLGDAFIKVYDFDATLVGRSYMDFVVTIPASPNMVDNVSPNHLDTFHAFPSYSLPSLPLQCCDMSSWCA